MKGKKSMRRFDREVSELKEILEIINKCDACRIAFSDNNIPYIVPMNFGFKINDESLTLYLHCANEGKKINILKKNPNVCFEMDCSHELITASIACGHSMNYESIIGNSIAEFVKDNEEKKEALNLLMKKYTKKDNYTFDEKMLSRVTVLKLNSFDFTAKRRA